MEPASSLPCWQKPTVKSYILNHFNPKHNFTDYFLKIHFKILPSKPQIQIVSSPEVLQEYYLYIFHSFQAVLPNLISLTLRAEKHK